MRLRSGRTYSSRYFLNRPTLRNRNILEIIKSEMTTTTGTPTTQTPPVSSISTMAASSRVTIVTNSAITPFAGLVGGRLTQSVENFINAINSHLASKGIQDDRIAFQEARSYLALEKGDIGDWVRSLVFRCCDTWTELKSLLRQAYSVEITEDCTLFLRSIAKNASDRRGRSIVRVAAELSDSLVKLMDRIKQTNWVKGKDADGMDYMTLDKVMLLLQLSFLTMPLPDRLVSLFDEPFTIDATEITVIEQIRRHKGKLAELDPTILGPGIGDRSRPAQDAAVSAMVARNTSRIAQTQNRASCRNCNRPGHYARDCFANFCYLHNSDRHRFKDCRARQNNQRPNTGSNRNIPTSNSNQQQQPARKNKQFGKKKPNRVVASTSSPPNQSGQGQTFQGGQTQSSPP